MAAAAIGAGGAQRVAARRFTEEGALRVRGAALGGTGRGTSRVAEPTFADPSSFVARSCIPFDIS